MTTEVNSPSDWTKVWAKHSGLFCKNVSIFVSHRGWTDPSFWQQQAPAAGVTHNCPEAGMSLQPLWISSLGVTPTGPDARPTLCLTALKEEKISNYAFQFTKDRTISLAINFHSLRVNCVYVSGKVPMFTNAGRVWGWGEENRNFFYLFKPYS